MATAHRGQGQGRVYLSLWIGRPESTSGTDACHLSPNMPASLPKPTFSTLPDNLNTHHPSSLYDAFEPAEARRIAQRLEIHYTPKHGSWLNMAEPELAVLARQCLDRRIPDQEMLQRETRTWQEQRNREEARAHWRFTTQDARLKLRSLYPSLQS